MKKKYLLFLLLMPFIAFAEPNYEFEISNNTIEIGKSIKATVKLTDVAEWDIQIEGTGSSTCSLKEKDSSETNTNKSYNLECIGAKEGEMLFKITGYIKDETGYKKEVNNSKTATVYKIKSNNNLLNVLKVDGLVISDFTSEKFEYTIPDTRNKSIRVEAVTQDSFANVSGTGNIDLKYGKNVINITVKAENGEEKNYVINVNRIDDRDSNTYLKSLKIGNEKIDFNKTITSYTVKVEHDVNEINIIGEVESSKSTINGNGTKKLKDYTNEFKIIVTAENGSTKEYSVRILRKDKDGNFGKLSDDNKVKDINIKEFEIKFDPEVKKYNVLIEEENKLEIEVITNDNTSTVEIKDNSNFKGGLNKVTIVVTSESGKTNEYLLNVYKIVDETTSTTGKNKDNKTTKKTTDVKEEPRGKVGRFWIWFSLIEFAILAFIFWRKFDFKQLIPNPSETKEDRDNLRKVMENREQFLNGSSVDNIQVEPKLTLKDIINEKIKDIKQKIADKKAEYVVASTEIKENIENKVEETKQEIDSKIEVTKENIEEKTEEVKEEVKEKVEEAKENIESTIEVAKETIEEKKEEIVDKKKTSKKEKEESSEEKDSMDEVNETVNEEINKTVEGKDKE